MKTYRFQVPLVVLSLFGLLTSCSDFLEQSPKSYQNVENFYKTLPEMEEAINGALDAMQSYKQYGGNFIFFMEVRADNTTEESFTSSGGIYGDFDLFREIPTNQILSPTWASCYQTISQCNIVLDRIANINGEEAEKNKYVGEALFLRALTYFNMVRIWGDVPLILHEVDDPFKAFDYERTPKDEVYKQIVEDLEKATPLLPLASKTKKGLPTSGAAATVLGEVYLTLHEYGKALVPLKAVLDSKEYKLMKTYAELFDPSNKNTFESIFEIQYNGNIDGEGSRFANMFAPKSSKEVTGGIGKTLGDNIPTDEFYASFEKGDVRRDITIGVLKDLRKYCKKFVKAPAIAEQSDANFIVYRLADVYLMYGEALNETGDTKGSLYYINKIRSRAGLSNLTTTDKLELREAYLNERRHELGCENHRWFDLLRTGKAISVMNAVEGKDYNVEEYKLLFPIPQRELDASDKMTQNPKY